MKGYVICSEPRSGTNYFCELLASTGLLGRPREYFETASMRAQVRSDYPDDLENQFAAILGEGSTPNHVYGLKMFSTEFDRIAPVRWASRLPELNFVHFERLDYLDRAISAAKAIQTGDYWTVTTRDGGHAAVYDRELIRGQIAAAARGHARWRMYFARNGLTPLRLTYEGLLADPGATVQSLSDFIGVAQPLSPDLSTVKLTMQRDEVSKAWRERFLSEESGLDRLDPIEKDTAWAWLRRQIRKRGQR
jgi:trehalose 2-sulfotransferase